MKTQIIQLEPHDDIISVRDKLTWVQAPRTLLVWPDGRESPLLFRRLDLLLLHRQAEALRTQLGFVTRDPDVRYYAGELRIPVFDSASQAQRAPWRRHRRLKVHKHERSRALRSARLEEDRVDRLHQQRSKIRGHGAWQEHPAVRIGFFLLAILAVFSLAGVIVPRAEISVEPVSKPQTVTLTALTGPTITSVNATGAIPTRQLKVIVEGRNAVETTGSLLVPDTRAGGVAQFTNLTASEITIPAGTVVLTQGTDPLRFATTVAGTVPAEAGATVEIAISAVEAGSEGNIAPGEITAIEGGLGLQLTVNNPIPTTGGGERTLAAPNDLDRRRAYRELLDALRETAALELQAQLEPGDILLSDVPFLLNTLEETYSPVETVPTDLLEVTLRLEFQMLVLRQDDLIALGKAALDAVLEDGFEPVDDVVFFELLTEPALKPDATAQWDMKAERVIRSQSPTGEVVPLVLGRSPADALARLDTVLLPGMSPQVALDPGWWPWMPLMPFQVDIVERSP